MTTWTTRRHALLAHLRLYQAFVVLFLRDELRAARQRLSREEHL